ncbi:MAG: CcmD family protein [Bacteroidota bacterium]
MMNKFFVFKVLLLLVTSSYAQVEMADDFRGEGKIYVVIAIFLLIIIGFFVLLFKLDRRTKRLEQETKNNEN